MQKSTEKQTKDTSPGQSPYVEMPNKEESSNEITHEHIPGTPFTYRRFNDKHIITMGDYKLIEPKETKEEALNTLQPITWEMIFKVIATAIEIDQKLRPIVTSTKTMIESLERTEKLKNL